MTKILVISGSLRLRSYNTALAHAAKSAAPDGVEIDVIGIVGIPLFNEDVESAAGIPDEVLVFKSKIKAADGVILATPEYNRSIPGVFKNAIDWASRPGSEIGEVFGGKPFALMGASPGSAGTVQSQAAWLDVLHGLGATLWTQRTLRVGKASDVFEDGKLVDDKMRERLASFVKGFADFIE